MFFGICPGEVGKAPSDAGRMEGGNRSGDCIMVDFYKRGRKKNKVVVKPKRKDNSTSYPILVYPLPL